MAEVAILHDSMEGGVRATQEAKADEQISPDRQGKDCSYNPIAFPPSAAHGCLNAASARMHWGGHGGQMAEVAILQGNCRE